MIVFSCDHLDIKLPSKHRFPIEKYSRLRAEVETLDNVEICLPWRPDRKTLERVHSKDWVARVLQGTLSKTEIGRIGFPWSMALVERSLYSVGCTVAATFEAMRGEISCNLAGGTHHAGYDYGEGFCVFNDVAIAVSLLMAHYPGIKILIVDADVHQGNGTADLLGNLKDVFTLSLHSARNYPHEKSHSNIDVSFPDETEDLHYLDVFSGVLDQSIESAKPDFVFFLAGADIFQGDRLGRLGVSKEGIKHRDTMFFSKFISSGTKIAVVMGGGYAPSVEDIVDIHLSTIRCAVNALLSRNEKNFNSIKEKIRPKKTSIRGSF